jgi:hypothetical protein
MSGPAKSILGRLSRFHTRDADEAQAFLSTKDYELDLSRRDARQIDLRINGVYLPGAYVGYFQYGAPIVARTHADRHDYWINLPLEEAIEATIGADHVEGSRCRRGCRYDFGDNRCEDSG